ncbi:MAG: oxidoreductase [Nitrospiraceae bacterium]|nr:MAG: oxidoreductase [Nitrospiraceae bacterium]
MIPIEVHGEAWTLKELFTYPNEYIYWTIQIVMYPFMTGLVAGAFVLSSLYHVFGIKQLKDMARFALVFSFALLPVAPLPLLFHLQQAQRNINVFMTPHFTSAIAAFGLVFATYGALVAYEIWFVYREHLVKTALSLRDKADKTMSENVRYFVNNFLTFGAYDISEEAIARDEKSVKLLASIGIPIACFLHGYAGFIFGSVKANALWMTPLMPVIFIMSAIVSGVALCMLTYIIVMELRKLLADRKKPSRFHVTPDDLKSAEINEIKLTSRYLLLFMIFAISLELLDLIFRGYTAVKSWDILRSVIYGKDFANIFILQYLIGNLLPFAMFLLPGLTIRRTVIGTLLVLFGVFMMRWNVVIGGQSFSLTFAGYMHYVLPVIPHNMETYKEGVFGALTVMATPYVLFWLLNKIFPVFIGETSH